MPIDFRAPWKLPQDEYADDPDSIENAQPKWATWNGWAQQRERRDVKWPVKPELIQKWRDTLKAFQLGFQRLSVATTPEEKQHEHRNLINLKRTTELLWGVLYETPDKTPGFYGAASALFQILTRCRRVNQLIGFGDGHAYLLNRIIRQPLIAALQTTLTSAKDQHIDRQYQILTRPGWKSWADMLRKEAAAQEVEWLNSQSPKPTTEIATKAIYAATQDKALSHLKMSPLQLREIIYQYNNRNSTVHRSLGRQKKPKQFATYLAKNIQRLDKECRNTTGFSKVERQEKTELRQVLAFLEAHQSKTTKCATVSQTRDYCTQPSPRPIAGPLHHLQATPRSLYQRLSINPLALLKFFKK